VSENLRNLRRGLLKPDTPAPPVGVRIDDAAPHVSRRVTAADPVPGGICLGEPVLGKILGPAAVTGQQLRQPDHLALVTRDEIGELAELIVSGHRTALLSLLLCCLNVPDAAGTR